MRFADLIECERDENGQLVGFGVGKEAALREWRHRRERASFATICNVLRASKWNREHRERRLQLQRESYHRNKGKLQRTRAEEIRSTVYRCERDGCDVEWCRLPTTTGRPRKYCSKRCEKSAEYRRSKVNHGNP